MGSESLAVRTLLIASACCLAGCGGGATLEAPAPAARLSPPIPNAPVAAEEPPPSAASERPESSAAMQGLPTAAVEAIDRAVEDALARDRLPGCVVAVGRSSGILFEKAYGARSLVPERAPMTTDTVFDLASVTKAVATTIAVLQLVEQGRVELDAPVARYLPAFARRDKQGVTVRHLLLHAGGLPAVNPLTEYGPTRAASLRRIFASRRSAEPGASFRYSDLGFIVLGALIERVTGEGLDVLTRRTIFAPLAMHDTTFLPGPELRARAAPTELRHDVPIVGEVDDPRAYRLGGVAGNAGLFSTAGDLARLARMLLSRGSLDGARVLAPATLDAMTRPVSFPAERERRGLGWSMAPRPEVGFSARAYGHGGYTGTSLWLDPERDLFVVFLSNAVHPARRQPIGDLAALVAASALGALTAASDPGRASAAPSPPAVLAGVDVLVRDGFAPIAGARAGLLTNASVRARDGRRTLDVLAEAPGVDLRVVFSPEHGLDARDEGGVDDARDGATGLPVRSLFGARRRPAAEDLAELDVLVVDLQDVGTRFYTYASTTRAAMEAAADAGLRVVILDRPNPLGGTAVEGPLTDPARLSFVNANVLPIRHGLTLGELARLFRARLGLELALEVIPVEGWRREALFAETGLAWVPPSPNLPRAATTLAYPAVGLLEGTNVSVGRGTERPFEVLGAPWLDPPAVLASLGSERLPGVRFAPTRFTPTASRHRGRECGGIAVEVTDPGTFRPVRTGLALARALLRAHPDRWEPERLDRLLASPRVYTALLEGRELDALTALFRADEEAFRAEREPHLLYR